MTKAEYRQQRRALIDIAKAIEAKHARATTRQSLIAAERPPVPSTSDTESNEWSNYLYDKAEWQARYDAAKRITDSRHKAFVEAKKRIEEFLPRFDVPEDDGE